MKLREEKEESDTGRGMRVLAAIRVGVKRVRGEERRKRLGGQSPFFYPHIPSFTDFKETPGEKELFLSAQPYCFVTLLFSLL